MNLNAPFVATPNGYAIYFDHLGKGHFDFGAATASRFVYTVVEGQLSYFLIAAPTIAGQLEKYTWLTGRQPLPPKWAFGFIQSKFGYQNETEARAAVASLRQKRIPCDAIVLDLYWFNHMGDLNWKSSDWPNPFQMMRDFLEQGIRTIVITEPYLAEFSSNFSEALALGYLAKHENSEPYLLENWWSCNCNAGLLDMTNPAAAKWWWDKHPPFMGNEMAGLWTDLGEPERHPDDMRHHLGTATQIHNLYNFLWAKTIFEGFNEFRPNQRLFNLTRSGYAGIQRFGVVTWSGDVSRTFAGLAAQPAMLLNTGLSGLGYHNSDIGGFCCGFTTPELYVRWMQFGAFCPITRAHGAGQPTEPWEFGAQAEAISKTFIELRYQLLPYIYTLAYENYRTGLPLARPLFFADEDDPQLRDESSSYLFGDALLVSPVVNAGQSTKSVYLPRGKWVNFWSDVEHVGGQTVAVDAPLETMPLFVKSGSIIPMQSVMNYTNERQLDTLRLAFYPSPEVEGQFTLYEDDGETLEYQNGNFALTDFSQHISIFDDQPALFINIGATTGAYSGQLSRRVYLSEIHRVTESPARVTKNGAALAARSSLAELRTEGDGFFYDSTSKRLYVQTSAAADSAHQIIVEKFLITAVQANEPGVLRKFQLEPNYPNPFNPTTTIAYRLSIPAQVTLKIFDVLGRLVATLGEGKQTAGEYKAEFNTEGIAVPSGVYFYRLTAQSLDSRRLMFSETKKMLLIK
jgi:alpha-glucosidase (family GH31 glycosyl hydrolase)